MGYDENNPFDLAGAARKRLAANQVQEDEEDDDPALGDRAKGALGGAVSGATAGLGWGPVGALIGGVGGALFGGATAKKGESGPSASSTAGLVDGLHKLKK